LTGDRVAAVTAVITPPDYLFFLETRWILRGFATVNISPSRIPSSGSETFLLLETLPDRIPPGSSVTYPAWKFLSPGYFNSYSYTARGQTAIRITEGKREE